MEPYASRDNLGALITPCGTANGSYGCGLTEGHPGEHRTNRIYGTRAPYYTFADKYGPIKPAPSTPGRAHRAY